MVVSAALAELDCSELVAVLLQRAAEQGASVEGALEAAFVVEPGASGDESWEPWPLVGEPFRPAGEPSAVCWTSLAMLVAPSNAY